MTGRTEAGLRAFAKSGLLLGDDVTASKSVESSEEILPLARTKNALYWRGIDSDSITAA